MIGGAGPVRAAAGAPRTVITSQSVDKLEEGEVPQSRPQSTDILPQRRLLGQATSAAKRPAKPADDGMRRRGWPGALAPRFGLRGLEGLKPRNAWCHGLVDS
jgi:hypothetical protein